MTSSGLRVSKITGKAAVSVCSVILLTLGFGCATNSPEKVSDQPMVDQRTATEKQASKALTNEAAKMVEANHFVEITFKPGSTSLTDTSKSSIRAVLEQARREGKIDDIKVLSWADEEYPAESRKKLPNAQRDLATKRNKVVSDYIKSVRSVDVDTYNMAEQPTVFSRWFNTEDARLKRSLVAAGLPTTASDPQYPSKASHSVILVSLK